MAIPGTDYVALQLQAHNSVPGAKGTNYAVVKQLKAHNFQCPV